MVSKKIVSSEREGLENYIGTTDVIPRPAEPLKEQWNAHSQAELIISRVRHSLVTNSIYESNSDLAAALRFNRSALGYALRSPSKQNILLTATKIIARDAGLNPDEVSIQKQHDDTPSMYVVVPNKEAAFQLRDHIEALSFKEAEPA